MNSANASVFIQSSSVGLQWDYTKHYIKPSLLFCVMSHTKRHS